MGVHTCPKKFEGRNPQFLAIFGPKVDTLSPSFPNAGKIWISKTIMSICGYVSTSMPNMVGVPPPNSEIGCPLGVGVGQVNFESI